MEQMKPVVFKLDEELYGIDIICVQGIEKGQQIVRVPNTASYIRGIMNLRGEVIPVYDLRKKFGMPENNGKDVQYIIVRSSDNTLLALEVDVVDEIHNYTQGELHPIPEIVKNRDTEYFNYVINSEKGMVIIIDIDRILTADEKKQIENMKETLQ